MKTIVDYLHHWAARQPAARLFTFLDVDGAERETLTWAEFHDRTALLAAVLVAQKGMRPGERALLVYPPGLELIAAFIACARTGVIPVPAYPPAAADLAEGLARLARIAADCGARAALTVGAFRDLAGELRHPPYRDDFPALARLDWIATDEFAGPAPAQHHDRPGPVLFLQYTSGSTSEPKGVIVAHDNLLHNALNALDHLPVEVSWLPQYHDMGLIGAYLYPLIRGGYALRLLPGSTSSRDRAVAGNDRPRSRHRFTASPNFGFEYCLREDKVPTTSSGRARPVVAADPDERRRAGAGRDLRALPRPVRALRSSPDGTTSSPTGWPRTRWPCRNRGRQIVTVNKRAAPAAARTATSSTARRNNNQAAAGELRQAARRRRRADRRPRDAPGARRAGRSARSGSPGTAPARATGTGREADRGGLPAARIANDPATRPALPADRRPRLPPRGRALRLRPAQGPDHHPRRQLLPAGHRGDRRGVVAADPHRRRRRLRGREHEGDDALVVLVEVRKADDLPDPATIARAIRTQYYGSSPARSRSSRRRDRQDDLGQDRAGADAPALAGRRARGASRTHRFSRAARPRRRRPDRAARSASSTSSTLYNLTGQRGVSRFADVGLDSLTLVRCSRTFKVAARGARRRSLAPGVDVRLLQRLTRRGVLLAARPVRAAGPASRSGAVATWLDRTSRRSTRATSASACAPTPSARCPGVRAAGLPQRPVRPTCC